MVDDGDDGRGARVIARMTARNRDASLEYKMTSGVIKEGLSGGEGSEKAALPSIFVLKNMDCGKVRGAANEITVHPVTCLVRGRGEDDISGDPVLAPRKDPGQFFDARAGTRTTGVGQHHQGRPVVKALNPARGGPVDNGRTCLSSLEFMIQELRHAECDCTQPESSTDEEGAWAGIHGLVRKAGNMPERGWHDSRG